MVKGPMNSEVLVFKSRLAFQREIGNTLMADPCAYASDKIRTVRKEAGASAVMIEDTAVIAEHEFHYVVNVDWYEND